MWPDRRLLDLVGIELPIIQAPMAGANGSAMTIAVSAAGGLGSLPCAMLDAAAVRTEIEVIRQHMKKPLNVNFFCHTPPTPDPELDAQWTERLAPSIANSGSIPRRRHPLSAEPRLTMLRASWSKNSPPKW